MADALVNALAEVCGASNVVTGEDARAYNHDFLNAFHGNARAVVMPANENEVSQSARLCYEARAPIVPHGGNTSYAGGATPDKSGGAIVMAMKRMRKVLEVDARNMTMSVEAGCVLEDARAAAAAKGLLFPLSLGAKGSCQIGGNLATNAGGLNVLRYGNARDLCLSLRAVLADGNIAGELKGLRKDNTGYDLKHLFIGSEGTLGIITAAVFKLFAPPAAFGCAFVEVESPSAAMDFLQHCREEAGGSLEAFELMPQILFELLAEHQPRARNPFGGRIPKYAVLFEFAARSVEEAEEKTANVLESALEKRLITDAVPAQNETMRAQFWHAREVTPEATKRAGQWIKMDVSLPLSRLAAFVGRMETALPNISAGKYIVAFGHLGDGNLHLSAMPDDDNAAETIRGEVYETVREFGGSFSAEHGIGQSKPALLARYKDAGSVATMRAVKHALDARNIMNPGKVVLMESGGQ